MALVQSVQAQAAGPQTAMSSDTLAGATRPSTANRRATWQRELSKPHVRPVVQLLEIQARLQISPRESRQRTRVLPKRKEEYIQIDASRWRVVRI